MEDRAERSTRRRWTPPRYGNARGRPTRDRPNFFVGFRITSPAIRARVEEIQSRISEAFPHLSKCHIDPNTLHVTLCVLRLPDSTAIAEAAQLLQHHVNTAAVPAFADDPPSFAFTGWDFLGNRNVLHTGFDSTSCHAERLEQLAESLHAVFDGAGFASERFRKPFTPHLTIWKTSRDRDNIYRLNRGQPPGQWVQDTLFEFLTREFAANEPLVFGIEAPTSVELLSMQDKEDDGYYRAFASCNLLEANCENCLPPSPPEDRQDPPPDQLVSTDAAVAKPTTTETTTGVPQQAPRPNARPRQSSRFAHHRHWRPKKTASPPVAKDPPSSSDIGAANLNVFPSPSEQNMSHETAAEQDLDNLIFSEKAAQETTAARSDSTDEPARQSDDEAEEGKPVTRKSSIKFDRSSFANVLPVDRLKNGASTATKVLGQAFSAVKEKSSAAVESAKSSKAATAVAAGVHSVAAAGSEGIHMLQETEAYKKASAVASAGAEKTKAAASFGYEKAAAGLETIKSKVASQEGGKKSDE